MHMNFNDNMETALARLESFFRNKTVIGEPQTFGDTTLIPVIDIGLGIGIGGGDGTEKDGSQGTGGGGGVGAKGSPQAIVVLRGDTVEVLPIQKQATLEKLVALVPELVDILASHKSKESPGSEEKTADQDPRE